MIRLTLQGRHGLTQENFEELRSLGYTISEQKDITVPFTEEQLMCEVLVQSRGFRHHSPEDFPNLKFVHGLSAGFDGQPVEELRAKGIPYCKSDGVFGVPIAEFAVMRILEHAKKARLIDSRQLHHTWIRDYSLIELTGKTALVIGTGDIGKETAKRLKAFDMKVIGFNKSLRNPGWFDEIHPTSELESFAAEAYAVVMTLPHDEKTHHLLGKSFFEKMDTEAIYVNISRGGVNDQEELLECLKTGHPGAAALDVFEVEPLPADHPFWNMHNVYISAHNTGDSDVNDEKSRKQVMHNLRAYLTDKQYWAEVK